MGPMKSSFRFLLCVILFAFVPDKLFGQDLPEFRPALLKNGKNSLVNLINTESLFKRGQRDATIMFSCGVTRLGEGYAMEVYRCSPNSDLLQKEVLGRIVPAQFEPAVFHHNHINVWINGTIVFVVIKEKPHLRIFLNQEEDQLKAGADFISPQYAIAPGNTKFRGIYWPPGAPGRNGLAAVRMDVDLRGNVSNPKVVYEFPANHGFGTAVAGPIVDGWFIPGFRNGKIVPCRFTWTALFFGAGLQMQSG
jgi:hypothetical protein